MPPSKSPLHPPPQPRPVPASAQVESLLLAGQTFRQIAAELGITYGTVLWTAQQVYKQHGVRTLHELLHKHAPPGSMSKDPLTKQARHLLLSGISIPEIAAWTGANKTLIYNQRQQLRKEGKKLPDARVYNGGRRSPARAPSPPLASTHSV